VLGPNGIDYIGVIEAEATRARAALATAPTARIPWSVDWLVQDCALHLAITQRFGEGVVAGRPTVGWDARTALDPPDPASPALEEWVAESADRLVSLLRATDPAEPCWSWWPQATDVSFWSRRMAHETLVHRWDLELGAGIDGAPMDPAIAADGIDETLDVFVGMSRLLHAAPGAGETFHVHCTDTDGEWVLVCSGEGERELRREHAKGDVAYRGPAEGLLLVLWGRVAPDRVGVEVLGDPDVAARWGELVPSM
jgi:uncharacterized protein (TIGR03083 family)